MDRIRSTGFRRTESNVSLSVTMPEYLGGVIPVMTGSEIPDRARGVDGQRAPLRAADWYLRRARG